jgi:phosphate transport system permease protein
MRGRAMRAVFLTSTVVALAALAALAYTIGKEAVGLVAVQDAIPADQLSPRPLDELSHDELVAILQEHVSPAVVRRLEREQAFRERSRADLLKLVIDRVVEPEVLASWPLNEALSRTAAIEAEVARLYPEARLEWRSWVSWDFLTQTMSSDPARAGVRTALLGSLWMIAITLMVAFPLGVAAAVYLEEYSTRGRISRLIQTNIDNLAGVPSIIYGMLGLAIFVRALEPLTSGAAFGLTDTNGRTILSAGLTMALLILPVIIINAQEAVRAVPTSLREAAYGLGATRWQTVWGHVLPSALPGILTGTILAMSRAIGETAPLIVVGASTFIVADPNGPFSKFTALPIQIYNWTSRPQDLFRDIAAAAIVVLLGTLLSVNAAAILLRDRLRRRVT